MTSANGGNVRKISNSEVATWLQCHRRYYYQFDLQLEPINQGDALNRGIIGHEVLAAYYEALRTNPNLPAAIIIARSELVKYMDGPWGMELVTDLDLLLNNYWQHYADDFTKYEILEVEKQYELPLTDEFTFVMRFDLLVKERSSGLVELWDHKFVYDFWREDDLNLNPQFPKYLGTLRANGIQVDKTVLNQIRYRKLKDPSFEDLFRRTPHTPSNAKIRNALREQIIASKEIATHRDLPLDVRSDHALGVRNKMICKGCSMASLCLSEYDGGDITYLIQNEYKASKYGYNNEPVDMAGI